MTPKQIADHYYTVAFGIRMERERNELLAALISLVAELEPHYNVYSDYIQTQIDNSRIAIAKMVRS